MPPRSSAPAPSGGNNIDSLVVDITVVVVIFLLLAALFGSVFGFLGTGYVNLVQWFYGLNWLLWYIVAAIIVGILDIVLLALAVFIIKRYNALRGEVPPEEIASHLISPQQEFQQNWQDIQRLIASANSSDWNMAILRADAQLEDALIHLGYEGETIAERLQIVDPTKVTSMDRVWSAHRLRNTIAHDPLQQYTREMITHALDSYQIAFKELGFLQEAEL